MPMSVRRPQPISHFQRAFAALAVALVLALGVFGANAQWHAALHDHDDGHHHAGAHAPAEHTQDESDGCAVELYASGVSVPVEVPTSVAGPGAGEATRLRAVVEVWVGQPAHRLMPGRGPPRG